MISIMFSIVLGRDLREKGSYGMNLFLREWAYVDTPVLFFEEIYKKIKNFSAKFSNSSNNIIWRFF